MTLQSQKAVWWFVLAVSAAATGILILLVNGPLALPEHMPLMPPDNIHWLGTDNSGRDILLLLLDSAGISLSIGLGAALFAVATGAMVGCSAGYLKALLSDPLMRLTDVFLLIPTLPLVIVLSAYLGGGVFQVALIIALTAWPSTARVIHARVLALRSQVFILNAESMGAGKFYNMIRHILPNCSDLLLAKVSLTAATAMLAEAGISFLGLGDPANSSWGSMLHNAFSGAALLNGYLWWYLPPVLCISFSIVIFNWIGHLLADTKQLNNPVASGIPKPAGRLSEDKNCKPPALVSIRNLKIEFTDVFGEKQTAIKDLCIDIRPGEKSAVIGETGSGKSLLLLSVLGLLPAGAHAKGDIWVSGRSIWNFSSDELRRYRRQTAAYIPQGLGNALNPLFTAGYQVGERVRICHGAAKAGNIAIKTLLKAGFSDPEWIAARYPHQLSGGMKQRVLTAMALTGDPALMLADEPTKGLDPKAVTQMVDLFSGLESKAVLAVTHDLSFARALGGRIIVMLAGQVLEITDSTLFFNSPLHPYSKDLVYAGSGCAPHTWCRLDSKKGRNMSSGCPYRALCADAFQPCTQCPPLVNNGGHLVRCWLYAS